MTIEEAIKAMQNKQHVYYIGDCYDIIRCKESTDGDLVRVQQRSLNNRYDPKDIEPRKNVLTMLMLEHIGKTRT